MQNHAMTTLFILLRPSVCDDVGLPPHLATQCSGLFNTSGITFKPYTGLAPRPSQVIPAAPSPQGIGQGNGAGPAIWCVVSTPILNMLRAAGHGIKFHSPLSGSHTHVVAYVFVDDCDICETAPDWECPSNQLVASMQASLDLWEGSLRATGGALVLDKSYWYLVLLRWKRQGEFCYATPQEAPTFLSVRGPDGQRKSL